MPGVPTKQHNKAVTTVTTVTMAMHPSAKLQVCVGSKTLVTTVPCHVHFASRDITLLYYEDVDQHLKRKSHWIGLRENLQETMVFTIKYRAFL
jgi:hypothetical protein